MFLTEICDPVLSLELSRHWIIYPLAILNVYSLSRLLFSVAFAREFNAKNSITYKLYWNQGFWILSYDLLCLLGSKLKGIGASAIQSNIIFGIYGALYPQCEVFIKLCKDNATFGHRGGRHEPVEILAFPHLKYKITNINVLLKCTILSHFS